MFYEPQQNAGLLSLLDAASALSPVKSQSTSHAISRTQSNSHSQSEEEDEIEDPTPFPHVIARKRRRRTTPMELQILEGHFKINPMPSIEERAEIGLEVNMSARAVQIWYQNRRQRERKLDPTLPRYRSTNDLKSKAKPPTMMKPSRLPKRLSEKHRYPDALPPPELNLEALMAKPSPPSSPRLKEERSSKEVEINDVEMQEQIPTPQSLDAKLPSAESLQKSFKSERLDPPLFPTALYLFNVRNAVTSKANDVDTTYGESSTVMKVRALKKKGLEERAALREQKSAVSLKYRELKKREIKAMKLKDYKFADSRLQKEFGGLVMNGSDLVKDEDFGMTSEEEEGVDVKRKKPIKPNLDIVSGMFETGVAAFPLRIPSRTISELSPTRSTASDCLPRRKVAHMQLSRAKSMSELRSPTLRQNFTTRSVAIRGMGKTISPSLISTSRPEFCLITSPEGRMDVSITSSSRNLKVEQREMLLEKMESSDPVMEDCLAQNALLAITWKSKRTLESVLEKERDELKRGKIVNRELSPPTSTPPRQSPVLKRKRVEEGNRVQSRVMIDAIVQPMLLVEEREQCVTPPGTVMTSPEGRSVPRVIFQSQSEKNQNEIKTQTQTQQEMSILQKSGVGKIDGRDESSPISEDQSLIGMGEKGKRQMRRRLSMTIPKTISHSSTSLVRTQSLLTASQSTVGEGEGEGEAMFEERQHCGASCSETSIEEEDGEGGKDSDSGEKDGNEKEMEKAKDVNGEEKIPSLTNEECANILLEFGVGR